MVEGFKFLEPSGLRAQGTKAFFKWACFLTDFFKSPSSQAQVEPMRMLIGPGVYNHGAGATPLVIHLSYSALEIATVWVGRTFVTTPSSELLVQIHVLLTCFKLSRSGSSPPNPVPRFSVLTCDSST